MKAVYVSVERDAAKMNHMHLAIASTLDTDLKKRIASAVNIRQSSIGNIKPIRGKNKHYNTSANSRPDRNGTLTCTTIYLLILKHRKMKLNSKITIHLSHEDKDFIQKKATENRQTVSGYARSKMFDRVDLRRENETLF